MDQRARTLDHVDTLKLGQQGGAVVKKVHAATVGPNQPSGSTSSTVECNYTQGYEKGYALGAAKFNNQRKPKFDSENRSGTNLVRGGGQTGTGGKKCVWCKGTTHDITHCDLFKKLTLEAKKTFVAKDKLCYNCLKFGHASRACVSTFKCYVCKGNHHTLLHAEQQPPKSS